MKRCSKSFVIGKYKIKPWDVRTHYSSIWMAKMEKLKLTIANAGEDEGQQELSYIGDGIMKW